MPNHQLLDNITHQNLRIKTQQHPELGNDQSYATVVLSELKPAQSEYPLFLRKNSETGQFEMIAMLGLDDNENLFLDESGWHAHYMPLSMQRRPFLIGFQSAPGSVEPQPVVHIDMDSPRVNETEGESVFLAQGGQSAYLQHISSVLKALHEGHQQTTAFVDALTANELLEPVDIKIALEDGSQRQVGGLYTVNEDTLSTLGGEALGSLHQHGYLEAIFMLVASTQNMTKLIERKNQRLA